MNDEQKKLIMKLSLGNISEDDFLEDFSSNIEYDLDVSRLLTSVVTSKDANELEYIMLLGFYFGFPNDCGFILCEILIQDWHKQHENIVSALQRIKFSDAADALYVAATSDFQYLHYDDTYSLGVKCEYALRSIGTEECKEKLIVLSKSSNEILAKNALKILSSH